MVYWRAGCAKRRKSGSEGGDWKRAAIGQHLAGRLPYSRRDAVPRAGAISSSQETVAYCEAAHMTEADWISSNFAGPMLTYLGAAPGGGRELKRQGRPRPSR